MGLFSPNYSKPGPGVYKDTPKKTGFPLYAELVGRKFFKLCELNMLHFLFSIPFMIILFLIIAQFFGNTFANNIISVLGKENVKPEALNLLITIITTLITMFIFVVWGSGPSSAAFAYITRCFTREEHAWMWSDYIAKFKENFKQSMIVCIIDIAAFFLFTNAINIYWKIYLNEKSFIWMFFTFVCFLLFLFYTFMHFYIYQLMVTYDCTLKTLYKDALLLALGKAPFNLLFTILAFLGLFFVFNTFQLPIAIILSFIIIYWFLRYPIEFYTARTIEKVVKAKNE